MLLPYFDCLLTKTRNMCHYSYWGYDRCCHEYTSVNNTWTVCPLLSNAPPHHCVAVSFTCHKIGMPFCDSCLDDTPPNHPPITAVFQSFGNLRYGMEELGISEAVCESFAHDYKAQLKHLTERAAAAGINNNYYNEVSTLHLMFCRRASATVAAYSSGGGSS